MRVHLAITLAAFAALVRSSAGSTPEQERETADLYRRGLAGDRTAVIQCIDKLEAELKSQPANQLARVYLGSTYTLRSRDLGFGPKKLQALNHGIALMDDAVAAAPSDTRVRLARALTTQSLPFFTGKAASSRKDFEWLAAAAERMPERFDDGDLQVIFYNAALAAKAEGHRDRAAALLRLAAAHKADPALARKVAEASANL